MVASTFSFSHLSPRSPRVASVCGNRSANQACHGPRSGMAWVLLPPHNQPCEHHTKHTRDAKRIITCGTKGPSYQTFETLSAAAACRTEVYVMPNHQQKLWSNFLWDTSLKLRYHTYGIAWRDDTYLLSNRMFHFQPGRHSTKTAARRPMRHFGRKMSKVYFFVHTRQDRGCEKPRRQHLSPSRPGIRLLASKKKLAKPLVQKLHQLPTLGMYDGF